VSDPAAGLPPPQGDLAALRRQLEIASADLYRQLALYQQVLREVLPRGVDQACFHLVTQVHPARYRSLPSQRRALFHQRLTRLVNRCSSLLTVEQVLHLAQQMGKERDQQRRQRQQQILEKFGSGAARPPADPLPAEQKLREKENPPSAAAPDGSVHLGFQLPLSGPWLGWGEPGEEAMDESAGGAPPPDDANDGAAASLSFETSLPFEKGEPSSLPDLGALLAAFGAAAELAQAADASSRDDENEGNIGNPDLSDALDAREAAGAAPFASSSGLFSLPEGGGLLPTDPINLLGWLEGYEQALSRRLRNLSHALNGELMRAGLSPILLPVNLLDAVLAGQVEGQGGPANILRLQLPMGLASTQGPLQAQAILLRCEDLELEHPRLRTVRRRLQQRRAEIRRMAHTYHRLQGRLQAREAEALWQSDIRRRRAEPEAGGPSQG